MMTDSSASSPNKKVRSTRERDELWKIPREELVERVIKQQQEIEQILARQANDTSLDDLRETVERLKSQVAESARQESLLVIRLADKEQEVQELMTQLHESKQMQNPSSTQLQSMLLDPAVNLLFVQMKREMDSCRNQLEQSQNDLAAWKFTPDSQTGKRLMAKCRLLLQENEELGQTVSSGRLAKLEGDIALNRKLIMEMKNSEKETEDFLGDADEDLEAMQSTIYLLQQELKEAKDCISKQLLELEELRSGVGGGIAGASATRCQVNGISELTNETSPGKETAELSRHPEETVDSKRPTGVLENDNLERLDNMQPSSKRSRQSLTDNFSQQSSEVRNSGIESMDVEADSTTGSKSSSRTRSQADHCNRTKTGSFADKSGNFTEDTKRDRSRGSGSSSKVRSESAADCKSNRSASGHGNKVAD